MSNKYYFNARILLASLIFFSFFSLFFGCLAQAIELKTLYDIEIKDSQSEQKVLLQQGLREVLVKLSGSEKILNAEPVLAALNKVDDFVKQFAYHEDPENVRSLRISFEKSLVNELIHQSGFTVLNTNRPSVLVWLTITQNNNTEWVSSDSEASVADEFMASAKRYGFPLIFPMLDLTDTAIINEQNVLKGDLETIKEASKRYNVAAVIVGKLSKQPAGWYAEWTLLSKTASPKTWDNTQTEIKGLIQEGFEMLTQGIAETFSEENRLVRENLARTKAGNEHEQRSGSRNNFWNRTKPRKEISQTETLNAGGLRIGVSGVSGLEDYARILAYLRQLPEVSNVEVSEITPEQTIFHLETTASQATINQTITEGNVLVELIDPSLAGSTGSHTLTYRMAPPMME